MFRTSNQHKKASSRTPSRRSPSTPAVQIKASYSAVHVLLLSWDADDLGVETEILELAFVLQQLYGFNVHRSLISSKNPEESLQTSLTQFVHDLERDDNLLIVYYAGHGALNEARLAQWYCTGASNSPMVRWYSHQRHLEDSTADVWLILDCCQPLGGGSSIRALTGKQVLAACGFGRDAPGVGGHSFTRALIQELKKSVTAPFTLAQLHIRVMNNLRSMVPDEYGERRETPILAIMGEGGFPSPSIRLVSYVAYPINLIAVMGTTGSGKSSLINRICQRNATEVGKGQASKTKDVQQYVTVANGQAITLIDTPGFDDTYLSDREILERISTYLYQNYQSGRMLNGILYLRDINLERVTGSARRNLDMFVRLCGEDSLGNVVLVTTKWDKANIGHALQHESELKTNFWAGMIALGSSTPHRLAKKSLSDVKLSDPVKHLVAPMLAFEPTYLQIQRELAKGKDLFQTAAGMYIDQSLSHNIEHYQSIAQVAELQAMESKIKPVKQQLKEQVKEYQDHITNAEEDKEALRQDFEKTLEMETERRGQLFGYWVLEELDNTISDLETRDKNVKAWTMGLISTGILHACKYVWKKQGKEQELIQWAETDLPWIKSW